MSLDDAIRILSEKVPPVPTPGNLRGPLQAMTDGGFPQVPPVPSLNSKFGLKLLEPSQAGNDLEPANESAQVLVRCWTPAGTPVDILADDEAHAKWIRSMNPPPPLVSCSECQHATIFDGMATCGMGMPSGLVTGGFWVTDIHLCAKFEGPSLP